MSIRTYLEDRWFDLRQRRGPVSSSTLGKIAAGIAVVLALYYPIGMIAVHDVNDDTAMKVNANPGQSQAVATAVALLNRELNDNRWTPMDPFFLPGAALDNMPNFQTGIVYAISRFAIEMSDQIGRVRGSSQVDEDLDQAAGLLKYKPDVWVYDMSESWLPQRSSAEQYRHGMEALMRYNQRLGEGNAVFETRADNLLATLERVAADMGSASAVIDSSVTDLGAFSWDADDVFYRNKGRLYAYFMLLEAMKSDFGKVIQEKQLTNVWDEMLKSLRQAAEMEPLVVINGAPDGFVLPSHLVGQGFYLLRARTQLREISNVLLK